MSIRGDHWQMPGLGFQSGEYNLNDGHHAGIVSSLGCGWNLAGKMGYGNEKNGGIIEKIIDIIVNIRDKKNHYR